MYLHSGSPGVEDHGLERGSVDVKSHVKKLRTASHDEKTGFRLAARSSLWDPQSYAAETTCACADVRDAPHSDVPSASWSYLSHRDG